jgi:hypothetical protein
MSILWTIILAAFGFTVGACTDQLDAPGDEPHQETPIRSDDWEQIPPPTAHESWHNNSKSQEQSATLPTAATAAGAPDTHRDPEATLPDQRVSGDKRAAALLRQSWPQPHKDSSHSTIPRMLLACQKGSAKGCYQYGKKLEAQGNEPNASQFYASACRLGMARSCQELGRQAELADAWPEARDFYAWGCLRQDKRSCQALKRLRRFQVKRVKAAH